MVQVKNKSTQIKIAFADDHTIVRKTIVAFLSEMKNIKVAIQAENGKVLIEKIDACKTKPDIIIMDINMPEMNGFDAVLLIKSKWPAIKILILSTYTEEIYIIRMARLGVNGFLSKTCDPQELETALQAIHDYGYYDSKLFRQNSYNSLQSEEFKLPDLTAKEQAFIKLCCRDLNYTEMSEQMNTTPKSVQGYRDVVFKKLQVTSRISLVLYAIRYGIVTVEGGKIQ